MLVGVLESFGREVMGFSILGSECREIEKKLNTKHRNKIEKSVKNEDSTKEKFLVYIVRFTLIVQCKPIIIYAYMRKCFQRCVTMVLAL